MKQLKIIGVILGLLATLNMAGCATIMSGGPTKINVTSNPSGAKVAITGITNGTKINTFTPFTTDLYNNSDYRFNFEMEGYASQTVEVKRTINGWVAGDLAATLLIPKILATTAQATIPYDFTLMLISAVVLIGGLVGTVTDVASNNIQKHDKDHIDVMLVKAGSASSSVMPIGKK